MKKQLLIGFLAAFAATPALAALKTGDAAPDFSAPASLSGKQFTFKLAEALKKGPAVVYFYPSAYTKGCDIQAHAFATNADKFAAAGSSIIGVSADSIQRLNQFSADPAYCAGKFPVASDHDHKVAAAYDLAVGAAREGAKDVRGEEIGHAFIERVTYVIDRKGKVVATLSSKTDNLSPEEHVEKSLQIVQAMK